MTKVQESFISQAIIGVGALMYSAEVYADRNRKNGLVSTVTCQPIHFIITGTAKFLTSPDRTAYIHNAECSSAVMPPRGWTSTHLLCVWWRYNAWIEKTLQAGSTLHESMFVKTSLRTCILQRFDAQYFHVTPISNDASGQITPKMAAWRRSHLLFE